MTENNKVWRLFDSLFENLQNAENIYQEKPLLAHYTSIQTVEKILTMEEVWLSNPLFMNDMEELHFGLNVGMHQFQHLSIVEEICGKKKADDARRLISDCFINFEKNHALNVSVFCLSEHHPEDNDGRLSMWRAYGSDGNGAAIVLNTEHVYKWEGSPLIFAKVDYLSMNDRLEKLQKIIVNWCHIVAKNQIPENLFYLAPTYLFDVLKFFSLTTKHKGFEEEREWRVIYMPERDVNGILKDNFGYVIGNRGVEPKLKLKIAPLPGSPINSQISLQNMLNRIILGPCVSSPLAENCFRGMLTQINKPHLAEKVVASTIPLRPTRLI
jgi:hypothetical protein